MDNSNRRNRELTTEEKRLAQQVRSRQQQEQFEQQLRRGRNQRTESNTLQDRIIDFSQNESI